MTDKELRKKQITAQRREQILEAAMEIFSQKGYSAATIPEIARLAGVASGTIYLYYPSKRDLFISVIENLLITPLLKIFETKSEHDFPTTLREALRDRLRILQSDLLTRVLSLLGEIQRDPELKVMFSEKLIRPFLVRLEQTYRSRIASGEFRRMDPAIAVRLVGSLMVGMNFLRILEGQTSPLQRLSQEQVMSEIMNFVLYGLMNGNTEEVKAK